jgi:hypothetical protein
MTSVPAVVGRVAVPSSAPLPSSTSAALVKVEPTSMQATRAGPPTASAT